MNHSRRLRLNVNFPLPHILKIAAMHAGSESLRFNPCLLLSRKPSRLPPLSQSAFAPGASITSGRVQPYCSLLLPTWPGSLLSDTGSSGLCCRQVPCLQLSVCWCPARPNCPDVIAVTKCASPVSTRFPKRATRTSEFINAPLVPVRCGPLFGRPIRRLKRSG